ncbi:MAG: diguanylate cyclase [Gammaproteobacteria bacterium]
MIESNAFLKMVIDSVSETIVVIDSKGKIVFVNKAWIDFGRENGLIKNDWKGVNYLKVCEDSAAKGDDYGKIAAEGIRKVIKKDLDTFYFEYPCHSRDKKRWFMMSMTPLQSENLPFYVITHNNITERKAAEDEAINLSRIDGLTNIPNRRRFDEFLNNEWRRCARLKLPVSLAFIDIDHFKLLNDNYGHHAGDECLIKVASLLNALLKRPCDLCARFGGDEFSLVFGETTLEHSLRLIDKLLHDLRELRIPNESAPTGPIVTVSIGAAAIYPDAHNHERDLIKAADNQLYLAKVGGRNRVAFNSGEYRSFP